LKPYLIQKTVFIQCI